MWIRELFAGLLGFASGLAVAGGMFALLIALGVISRFAGKTHTAEPIRAANQSNPYHSDQRHTSAAGSTHATESIRAANQSNPYHSHQRHTSAAGSTNAAEPIRAATESNPYHSNQWHTSAAGSTDTAEPIRAASKQNCSAEPFQQPICSPEHHPAFRQQPE